MIKNIQHFRELANLKLGTKQVTYTRHAHQRADMKNIRLPGTYVDMNEGTVIEEQNDQDGMKYVVRFSYNNSEDLIMVFRPAWRGKRFVCITVWTNHINDNHSTLRLGA